MPSRAPNLKHFAAACLGAVVLAACASGTQAGFGDSGVDSGAPAKADAARDATTKKRPTPCVPGRQVTCGCSGGASGFQVCEPDGGGYGACICSADATVHDAPAASDARADRGTVAKDAHTADGAHDSAAGSDAQKDVVPEAPPPPDASTCPLPTGDAGTGGALAWAENFGETGFTWATSVAIAPENGDIVVAGFFDGTVSFGGTLLTSHGDAASGNDTFVVRFDSFGNARWAKDFGNGLLTSANSVAVDGSGNVVLGGGFEGTLGFGGATLTAVGDIDLFVVELDPNGNYRWGKSFGAAGQYQELDSVAVDGAGDVVIGGTSVSVDFGSGPATGYFIAKFSQAGTYEWSTALAASCDDSSPTLAVDPQSNIILAGCFAGTVSFGGDAGTFTAKSGGDAFVAKYDSAGMVQWANHYPAEIETGGSGSEVSSGGLAVDGCGDIFLLGSFGAASGAATIDFGSGSLMAGEDSVFLAKLDAAGHAAWSTEFVGGTQHSLYPGTLAVDAEGAVIVAIGLAGTVDYGGGPVTSPSESTPTVSLASYDPSGIFRWSYAETPSATATPSSSTGSPQGIAARGATLVVAGTFGGCLASCNDGVSPAGTTLALPGETLTAVSAGDMFLATFAP